LAENIYCNSLIVAFYIHFIKFLKVLAVLKINMEIRTHIEELGNYYDTRLPVPVSPVPVSVSYLSLSAKLED